MNARPNREVALFSAALELPVGERAAYLDKACADDPSLRQRLEELLRVHQDAITFLENKAPAPQKSPKGAEVPGATIRLSISPAEKAGDRIGRYKLLQQIGEGGCGVVYMAEQEEPVRRRVALKVIKLGMDTKQVIARFEAERQALALMDHPNIAKVLDAGATDTGRPFFVMELVRGIKITDYCDENNLSTEERLDLFIQVCHAVQHAHQKGIIHRDIKPSNILVTINEPGAPGCPKIIDFGIAKATTGQALTDKTVFTAFEQFIGTPAYMSPEQAMMTALDIDTRTDIYSLGVLLYELLTGKTPLDQKELLAAGLEEMRRTIREKEPVRPSTRLSTMLEGELTTTAKHRHTDAPKLIHAVRGDLDWIVMKCLEKDRARRYETANGLATEISRYLKTEPVVARPPSRFYRLQKLVRRNKLAFAAASAIAAAVLAGLGASTWMFIRERAARDLAVTAEREQAELREQAEAARAKEAGLRSEAEHARSNEATMREQAEAARTNEARLRERAEDAEKVAQAARKRAEAGQTALLYWQALNALPAIQAVTNVEGKNVQELAALAARYDKAFKILGRAANIGSGCDWAANPAEGPEMSVPTASAIRQTMDAARLRAQAALLEGRPEDASQDLLATFVLGRHLGADSTLRSWMLQTAIESQTVGFVAENFYQFTPETLSRLQEGIENAPPHVNLSHCVDSEKIGMTDWLMRRMQELQAAALGDEEKALTGVRELLSSTLALQEEQVQELIVKSGGTSAGVIEYVKDAVPFYSATEKLTTQSPESLAAGTDSAARLIQGASNLIAKVMVPNLGLARGREIEAITQLAELQAALAYKQRGLPGFNAVRDPFGDGPFVLRSVERGFELHSMIERYGFNGGQTFIEDVIPR